MGTEPLISVGGHHRNGLPDDSTPVLANLRTEERAAMRARLISPAGRAAYARRKATVEPVFGQIRACRGFRQMSLRGLVKEFLKPARLTHKNNFAVRCPGVCPAMCNIAW